MSRAGIDFPIGGLTDGIVIVRLPSDADIPAIVEACSDPEIARFTTIPAPYQSSDARAWINQSAATLAARTGFGAAVVSSASGDLLGGVGLHNLDPSTHRCSAGYWVVPQARGRGVARRALRLTCEYAFDELWIEPVNRKSLRVAEAAGFSREGLLRSFMPVAGKRRSMLMYSLLPGEPPRAIAGRGAQMGEVAHRSAEC